MIPVRTVDLQTWSGGSKKISLLHVDATAVPKKFETTILTGQNGSHKSTLLKQLVAQLIDPPDPAVSRRRKTQPSPVQVVCASGSVADRFPQKEKSGGGRTSYDVSNYTYFGQRVYSNLLSKKFPLETLLTFSLSPSKKDRYGWTFYSEAHRLAGIESTVEYTFRGAAPRTEGVRNVLLSKLPSDNGEKRGDGSFANMGYKMAQWLLKEFTPEEFILLEELVKRPGRKTVVKIDMNGPICETATPNVIRLALLLDLIKLADAIVTGVRSKASFSIFELSSGEYHLLTTVLGIGFSLEKSSVLLIDEPENNLHPQWQRSLMSLVFDICENAMSHGHLIVSTHSPLIVGSAVQGSTVVDLSFDEPLLSLVSYGASSDQLLLNQFGVGSSRNKVVVDTIQMAISIVESGGLDSEDFTALIPALQDIREALLDTDPMVAVINALLDEENAL